MTLPFGRYIDEPTPARAQDWRGSRTDARQAFARLVLHCFHAETVFSRGLLFHALDLAYAVACLEARRRMPDALRVWTGHAGDREGRREVFLVRTSRMSEECR